MDRSAIAAVHERPGAERGCLGPRLGGCRVRAQGCRPRLDIHGWPLVGQRHTLQEGPAPDRHRHDERLPRWGPVSGETRGPPRALAVDGPRDVGTGQAAGQGDSDPAGSGLVRRHPGRGGDGRLRPGPRSISPVRGRFHMGSGGRPRVAHRQGLPGRVRAWHLRRPVHPGSQSGPDRRSLCGLHLDLARRTGLAGRMDSARIAVRGRERTSRERVRPRYPGGVRGRRHVDRDLSSRDRVDVRGDQPA